MNKETLKLKKQPHDKNLPVHFLVKVYDKSRLESYQMEFTHFKEAYEFYLQRESELGDIWKSVVMIEVTSRVINPELYSNMKIAY